MNRKTFDLEPNPFEQSFASKEKPESKTKPPTTLLGTTSSLLTPGGSRHLPPLIPSPSVHGSIPAGGATGNWRGFKPEYSPPPGGAPPKGPGPYFSSLHDNHTGLTQTESNLRSGMLPAEMGVQLPAMSHPPLVSTASGLMTPGLQSLLGSLPSFTPGGNATNASAGLNMGPTSIKPQMPAEPHAVQQRAPTKQPRSADAPTRKPEKKRKKNGNSEESPRGGNDRKSNPPEGEAEGEEEYNEENATRGLTEEEKRKHFLERNRLAASKCRARKKEHTTKMMQELKFYATECSNLTHQLNMVRQQVLNLRLVLFNHKTCPVLVESVGGVAGLNALLLATNYAAQLVSNNPIGTNLVANGVQPPPPSGMVEASVPTAVNGGVIPSNIAPLGLLGDSGEVKPTINSMMPPMMNMGMAPQLMGMGEGHAMAGMQQIQR